ncbi:hypothetical protein NBRC116592_21280 [Colwellia sp. KU-HH00111]|uniref:RHS repeat domain-containing protein n=1 Tax=Colwellia sp. KU-HH00111 TaxID=3127652 RepID=UPI00310A876A
MFPLAGKPKETLQFYKNNYLLAHTTNSYDVLTSANSGVFPYVSTTEAYQWSVDLHTGTPIQYELTKSLATQTFDDWGNLTSSNITLSAHNGSNAATTDTNNTYSPSGFDAVMAKRLGRISQAVVTKTRNGQSTSRASSYSYYSDGLLQSSSINGLTTTTQYDNHGNKTLVSKTGAVDAFGTMQTRSAEIGYSSNGRYALWKENALGERVNYTYNGYSGDSVTGRIWQMKTTDANSLSSTTHFGYAGETVKIAHSDGNESLLSREFCSTTYCENTQAYYVEIIDAPGKPSSKAFYNHFGQKIEKRTKGFDGRWVVVKTEFDDFSRPARVSQPHFDGSTPYYSEQTYDDLGRVVNEKTPDVNNSFSEISRQYKGLTTVITDPRNNQHTELRAPDGKLEQKTNLSGAGHQQTIDYSYNPYGQLTQATTSDSSMPGKQSVIVNGYDSYGQKISMDDPDKGAWTFDYNAFGEQISVLNANNQTLTNSYDILGRVIHRTDADGETCWNYGSVADAGIKAVGKLKSVSQGTGNTCSTPTYSEHYYFDSLGRLSQTDTLNQGVNFTSSLTYDQYSRVQEVNYPTGFQAFSIINEYNANHYPYKQTNGRTNALLKEVKATDAYGNVTDERFGNGTETTRIFRAETGHISSLSLTDGANNSLHQISYDGFDKSGNLTNRSTTYGNVASSSYSEVFTYDRLNRLTNRSFSGQLPSQPALATNFSYTYDGFGNFTDKAGDSSYEYSNSAKPNRLTRWDGQTLSYDDNGNVLTDGDRTFTYTAFDKASNISNTAGHSTSYQYGHKRQVIYRTDHVQEENKWLTKSTHYVGGSYQRVNTHYDDGSQADKVEHHYFVGGIKVTQYEATNTERTTYLHQDFQGSTITVTDDNATVLKQYIYTPFGEQKVISGGLLASNMARGYTGHEMVNHLNIIQMGGRIYDAKMGRFLQADIAVQAPNNTQSFNRYSYVMNNPMSYTDPSGYFFSKVARIAGKIAKGSGKAFRQAAQFGKKVFTDIAEIPILNAALQFAACAYGGPAGCAAYAAISTYAVTGSLKGAIIGAITAGIGGSQGFLTAGLIGGLASKAQGGNFGHGFWAAGLGAALGGQIKLGNAYVNVIASAVVGGTISKLTGGKFANGAQTWAFSAALAQDWGKATPLKEESPEWEAREEAYHQDETAQDLAMLVDGKGLLASNWPSFPQEIVNFSAGLGDALLFGYGDELRGMLDITSVNINSDAYSYGEYSSYALGGARLSYSGLIKGYSYLAPSGLAASAFRSNMKSLFRFGTGKNWRPVDLSKYPTDALLRSAAGRSNVGVNAYAVGVVTQPGDW